MRPNGWLTCSRVVRADTEGTVVDNRKKPAAKKKGRRKSNTMLWTWLAVGVVVAVVATVVLIGTSSTNQAQATDLGKTSAQIYNEVTKIPISVYNTVGVSSPSIQVFPPQEKPGQPPLTFTTATGTKLPGGFYWGAEFCPYCAATRWGLIAALSRFGTWTNMYNMLSTSNDVAPNTPTFSFLHATYTSPYLIFKTYEIEDRNGKALQSTPSSIQPLITKYNPKGDFPFINFNNHWFQSTAFDPAVFAGASRASIAAGLSDPTQPYTQAIVSSANYMSASICSMTKSAPASVCHSPGVMAAASALHITL